MSQLMNTPTATGHIGLIDSEVITIVLADDHTLLRGVLCDALEIEPDFTVLAQAGTGEDAVEAVLEHSADVLLLDLEMPGQDVRTTVFSLREQSPDTHVLILTAHDEPPLVQELLAAGVSGYLHKSVSRATLVSAIRALRDPCPQVTVAVSRRPAPAVQPSSALSSRELEVLTCVASALSNRQIASRLGIAEGTVKRHMQNIFGKLGAVSRIDAVNKAASAGLI